MLRLDVSYFTEGWTCTRMQGRVVAVRGLAFPLFECVLQQPAGKPALVGVIPIEGVGDEQLSATAARAIWSVTRVAENGPIDIGRLRLLSVTCRAGNTEVFSDSVCVSGGRLIGRSGPWDTLDGTPLSAWSLAMHVLCDAAFGNPQLAPCTVALPPPVYLEGCQPYCLSRDLPYELSHAFDVTYCFKPKPLVASQPDACYLADVDEFLCRAVSGYRDSARRVRFLEQTWAERHPA